MSAYALRCRVCEEVTVAEPIDACRRCDGPTDVLYDWTWVGHAVTRAAVAAGPPSLWRYHGLLPAGARVELAPGGHGSWAPPCSPTPPASPASRSPRAGTRPG